MLSKKEECASFVTLELAIDIHEKGVATVVTDGKYIQLDEEEK